MTKSQICFHINGESHSYSRPAADSVYWREQPVERIKAVVDDYLQQHLQTRDLSAEMTALEETRSTGTKSVLHFHFRTTDPQRLWLFLNNKGGHRMLDELQNKFAPS